MAELQATSVNQDAMSIGQLELGAKPSVLAFRRPFDPMSYDLDISFSL